MSVRDKLDEIYHIDEDNLFPRESYLKDILESIEGKYDDIADMENLLRALRDAQDVVFKELNDFREECGLNRRNHISDIQ